MSMSSCKSSAITIVMDETFVVSSIIDKLPPSWKDVRNSLKHKKDDMYVEQLGAHLRSKEGIRVQDGQKDVNPNFSTVNMVEDDKSKESSNPKKTTYNFTKGNNGKKPKFGVEVLNEVVGNVESAVNSRRIAPFGTRK